MSEKDKERMRKSENSRNSNHCAYDHAQLTFRQSTYMPIDIFVMYDEPRRVLRILMVRISVGVRKPHKTPCRLLRRGRHWRWDPRACIQGRWVRVGGTATIHIPPLAMLAPALALDLVLTLVLTLVLAPRPSPNPDPYSE